MGRGWLGAAAACPAASMLQQLLRAAAALPLLPAAARCCLRWRAATADRPSCSRQLILGILAATARSRYYA